jgi:hypothetical protein
MKNVSDKIYRGNQNAHFMCQQTFSENRAVFEIVWKIMVERDRV